MFRKKEQERRKEAELAASVTGQGIQITPSGRHDYKTPQVCRGPLPSSFPARTDLVASVHGSCQETISCHLSDCSGENYVQKLQEMFTIDDGPLPVVGSYHPQVHLGGIAGAHHGCCTLLHVFLIPLQPTLVGSSLRSG